MGERIERTVILTFSRGAEEPQHVVFNSVVNKVVNNKVVNNVALGLHSINR